MTDLFWKKLHSARSVICATTFGFIAAMPVLRAPRSMPWLALGTTTGTVLYVVALVLVGAAAVWVTAQETSARSIAERRRDELLADIHDYVRSSSASSSSTLPSAPKILDARLIPQSAESEKLGMFDLLVPIIVGGSRAIPTWTLDLTLRDGRKVTGLRGHINAHGFNPPNGLYELTVSFPFGGRIPDVASVLGARVDLLSGKDSEDRKFDYSSHGVPLKDWIEEIPPTSERTPITERDFQNFLNTGSTEAEPEPKRLLDASPDK